MVERLLVRLLPGDGEVPVLHNLPILRLQPRAKVLKLRHLLLEFHLQRRRDRRPSSFLARARARARALRRLRVGPVQVLQPKLALARGGGYLLDHAVHLVPVPLHRLRPRRRLGLVVEPVELGEFLPDVAEDGLDGGDVGEERLHARVPAAGSGSRGRRLLVSGRWRGGLFEGVTARLRTRLRRRREVMSAAEDTSDARSRGEEGAGGFTHPGGTRCGRWRAVALRNREGKGEWTMGISRLGRAFAEETLVAILKKGPFVCREAGGGSDSRDGRWTRRRAWTHLDG